MKKFNKIIAAIAACTACAVPLAACTGGNGGNDGSTETKYTVTFDTQGGSAIASQSVVSGGYATRPETDPTKDGYAFTGWYKEASAENSFTFDSEAITADTTIYAAWVDASNVATATFNWNYDGAIEPYTTVNFEKGKRIAEPDKPVREGYYFNGWFTESGDQFSAMKKYSDSITFDARWQKIYTFEAENTQLTDLGDDDIDEGLATESGAKLGFNFSGSANGTNLIKEHASASGGKYVSGLFYNGAYLQFEINSDTAVDDATIKLVLSIEYADAKLNSTKYNVTVNGAAVSFSEFSLGIGQSGHTTEPGPRGGFKEIYINKISLKQGENVIRLTVNNSESPTGGVGTIGAASPAVDCIKIYSSSTLTMTTYDNK